MKERLVTLLCALGALALFFTMFVHGDQGDGRGKDIPRPTTEERGGNGYRGAMQWLGTEHIRVASLRERFDTLAGRPGLAGSGNVLVVTLPATRIFRTDEFRPLDKWVRAGNTLLVVAALGDNPDWAFALGGMTAGDLNLLTGLEFETVKTREQRARDIARAAAGGANPPGVPGGSGAGPAESSSGADVGGLAAQIAPVMRQFSEARRESFVANRPHAYFNGVREVAALSDYPSLAWTVKVPYDGFVFALGRDSQTGEGALWTRPLGSGRIVVSGFGSIFTNRVLGMADNGRFLANIVGADLGPGGTVLFDDLHQGLGGSYDPAKFYRDRRLYLTVGILIVLWLSWVLGATKLRMTVVRRPAPREAELVRATGGFLARVLTPAAGARLMLDQFLRRTSWEALERHPRIAPADLGQLKGWSEELSRSGRVPLLRLHNLIVRINRQLNT